MNEDDALDLYKTAFARAFPGAVGNVSLAPEALKEFAEIVAASVSQPEEASTSEEHAAIAKELREIAQSGAMIHLLGWDDIQRTCDYAANLLDPKE